MKAAVIACTAIFLFGCSAETNRKSEPTRPNEIKIGPDQGVDFESGELVDTGAVPFSKADLYAIAGGTNNRLQLDTGKAKITDPSSPVQWFINAGIAKKFDSLDDVPASLPKDDDTTKLQGAEQGNGFVIKNYLSDGYTRGWISEATATSLTIEYEAIAP